MKIVYYVATSLDGFIADSGGEVDWLDELDINQHETGYDAFFTSIDALLMGRKTYDFVHNYGQWPYGDKPTWVCTNRQLSRLKGCNLQDEHNLADAIKQARKQGVTNLWVVGGGRLVGSLIQEQLLTHINISVMPILLGKGILLVHALPDHLHLHQENSTPMSGFTQIEYRIRS